jgi:hypothetical protein
MSVTAQTCPNCGAPLDLVGNLCAFCKMPLVVTNPAAPAATAASAASHVPFAPAAPYAGDPSSPFSMTIDDVFTIKKRGTVVTGRITTGTVHVGDELVIEGAHGTRRTRCRGVESFRQQLDSAAAGANVGLLLDDVDKGQVGSGDVIRVA